MNSNVAKWLELSPGLAVAALQAYSKWENRSFICPQQERVFRAFEYFPPEDTKVVIVGQDPYHTIRDGRHKASGLAFGYHPNYTGPLDSSLANIRGELARSGVPVPGFLTPPYLQKQWYTLEHWAQQGVLLLNTHLTVEQGKPLSHSGRFPGWEQPIAELIQVLDRTNRRVIWLLWGKEAQDTFDRAVGSYPEFGGEGMVIRTSHPCKYSHTNGKRPFTGSNCFTKVNELLQQQGGNILWGIDGIQQMENNVAG